MLVDLEIEQEDLAVLFQAYTIMRLTSWEVQDVEMQRKSKEQEKRIKRLIKPLLKK